MARKSTRDMIIGVAAELFATLGLRRTTMEIIAAAAGRGRRTIYMYFSNKSEIYEAVVENEINRIIKPLSDILASGDSFGMVLLHYSEERIRLLGDLAYRNSLLIKDFAMGLSRVEKLRERLLKEEIKIITPFFSRCAEELDHSTGTAIEDYVLTFLNMLRGNDRLLIEKESSERISDLMKTTCHIFLRGVRP